MPSDDDDTTAGQAPSSGETCPRVVRLTLLCVSRGVDSESSYPFANNTAPLSTPAFSLGFFLLDSFPEARPRCAPTIDFMRIRKSASVAHNGAASSALHSFAAPVRLPVSRSERQLELFEGCRVRIDETSDTHALRFIGLRPFGRMKPPQNPHTLYNYTKTKHTHTMTRNGRWHTRVCMMISFQLCTRTQQGERVFRSGICGSVCWHRDRPRGVVRSSTQAISRRECVATHLHFTHGLRRV